MRRRLLVIYKDPEFDERGEVVLGQCEPFTSGWKLVLVNAENGREVLLSGTYTDLRRIQESCSAITELELVRKRVQDMSALLKNAVTETVAVDFAKLRKHETTRTIITRRDTLPDREPVPAQLGEGLLELREEAGAIVVVVADPERASDAAALNPQLRKVLELKPRAIVVDLGRVSNLSSRVANELVLFRDECQEQHVGFGLCKLRLSVQKLFESLGHANPPAVYDTSEAALIGMAPGK